MDNRTPVSSLFTEVPPNETSGLLKGARPANLNENGLGQALVRTFLGSLIFLLYQVVFCLAQASTVAVSRKSFLGNAALMAALGAAVSGPVMIWNTATIPAVYPATDLFLAPFLAHVVDEINDLDDREFLTTFVALMTTGLLLSAALCTAAARFRWANITDFLPYPVLTGFFSTIGILIWMLGFSVDTGNSLGYVLRSPGEWKYAAVRHGPSVLVGILMHISARHHSLFVFIWIGVTVIASYCTLLLTGKTLTEAQKEDWFFSPEELQTGDLPGYRVTWPFGVWVNFSYISWRGYVAGLPPILALAVLYLLRCSLHAAALKKNAKLLLREGGRCDSSDMDVDRILERGYAYSHIVAALTGSLAVAPSVAASFTMVQLKAEGTAPQIGSCVLLLLFYVNDFALVQFIPKPAFSCLIVLAGLDISRTWLFDSYFKTKDKMEWLVGPFLVAVSFMIGLLNAIFLGIAVSAFLFIGNFYHAGIVKFVGTGLGLQSTVERGQKEAVWLERNGDWIQILVLQNYLFFGNCKSVLNYVSTMFEESRTKEDEVPYLPPIPKFLIIDFLLVSGMDTAAVDLFAEIARTCLQHECTLLISAMAKDRRAVLQYARVELLHVASLEAALVKAEDGLLRTVYHLHEKDEREISTRLRKRTLSDVEDGFLYALEKIDAQHGTDATVTLGELGTYTEAIDLDCGDVLTPDEGSLYFIEIGLLRIQAFRGSRHTAFGVAGNVASIGHLNARSATAGRNSTLWKSGHRDRASSTGSSRLALIGQGWLIGSTEVAEATNGRRHNSVYVAVSTCRVHCLPSANRKVIEEKLPVQAMHLYKTLAHLAVRRQNMTIRHLDQFVRILSTPAPRLRGGKASLAMIQDQVM